MDASCTVNALANRCDRDEVHRNILHLMHVRWISGMIEEIVQLFWTEVAHADVASLSRFNKTSHAIPSISILDRLAAEVAIFDGEVHKVKIQVFDSQHPESFVNCSIDGIRIVAVQSSAPGLS